MINTPNKVVIGSQPPQVWSKQANGDYIAECQTIVSFDILESIIDIAFSEGIAVVMIHQPDIIRSVH